MTTEQASKLQTAWSLIDPVQYIAYMHGENAARTLVEKGVLSWRDTINALVPQSRLDAHGVTIADVIEAVVHYTATTPVVTLEKIGCVGSRNYQGEQGWMVLADGYRRGPAGP